MARKTSPRNEEAWISAVWWSLLWNSAASTRKCSVFNSVCSHPAQFGDGLSWTIWLQNAKEPQAYCLWMTHKNTASIFTDLIYHFWCVLSRYWFSDLLSTQQESICRVSRRSCWCAHALSFQHLCVRDTVFDMTRGDLPSVFSILFLSWHVEPRSLLSWWQ